MRYMRLLSLVLPFVVITIIHASAQGIDTTLCAYPSVAVPLGPATDGLALYDIGGGGCLRGEFVPGFARWLFGRAFVDYEFLPLNGLTTSVSFISGGGTIGASYSPVPRLALRSSAGGGMYMAVTKAGSIRNPFLEGGVDVQFLLSPSLAAGLGARYKHFLVPNGAIYQGVSIALGVSFDLAGARKGTDIKVDPKLSPVFPLFYSYYNDHPMGTIHVSNDENIPFEKVKISFIARQYMDAPRACGAYDSIAPGTSVEVPLFALFNDAIFKVTEGTKAAGELIIDYYYLGRATTKTVPVTVQVQNRNAMTWDDDRKAAAFVTAKDPLVLGFAKGIASLARSDSSAVSIGFRSALGIFQGLGAHGMGYVIDPSTPFASTSATDTTVDFLQFPSQSLAYRAGDCDDLTILYCALLESVGIPSAFITVPGHIYAAFDSGLSPADAAKVFSNAGELIILGDKVWIPVEVTLVKEGFLRAWTVGAQEWRTASANKTAAMYPVSTSWELYAPVGFAEGPATLALPGREILLAAYRAEIERFARSQISSRVAEFQAQIKSGKDIEKASNKLGVLYAQYGLLTDARTAFEGAVKKKEYLPSLVNLGNLEFLAGDMKKAQTYFDRVLKTAPGDLTALVGLARSLQYGDDAGAFQNSVARLAAVYPSQAKSYFPEGVSTQRAASSDLREVSTWAE